MELLMHGGEHHEIGDGVRLMMMMATISPPEEGQGLAAAPYRKMRWILLSYFFLPEREYIELELRSVEVQGTYEAGGAPLSRGPPGPPPTSTPTPYIHFWGEKKSERRIHRILQYEAVAKP